MNGTFQTLLIKANSLVDAVQGWLNKQGKDIITNIDGTAKQAMGKEAIDILTKLKNGDREAISRVKKNLKVEDKFQLDKFDLITWLLVTI